MTDEGFAKLASAAPGHVEAVRAFVVDALDEQQLHELTAIGDTILKQLDGDGERHREHNHRSCQLRRGCPPPSSATATR